MELLSGLSIEIQSVAYISVIVEKYLYKKD